MKSGFSPSWNRSVQPRKQRKYVANAPNHIKRKMLAATLDKPLRTKLSRRSIELRKNDEVKVMRGKYAKKTGKVLTIDMHNSRIQIDGITITKKDGEKVSVWFHASNIKITKLEDSDRKRLKSTQQSKDSKDTKKPEAKKETKAEAKPTKQEETKAKK